MFGIGLILRVIIFLVGILFIVLAALKFNACPYSTAIPVLMLITGVVTVVRDVLALVICLFERCCPNRWEVSDDEYSRMSRPVARVLHRIGLVGPLNRTNVALYLECLRRILHFIVTVAFLAGLCTSAFRLLFRFFAHAS